MAIGSFCGYTRTASGRDSSYPGCSPNIIAPSMESNIDRSATAFACPAVACQQPASKYKGKTACHPARSPCEKAVLFGPYLQGKQHRHRNATHLLPGSTATVFVTENRDVDPRSGLQVT